MATGPSSGDEIRSPLDRPAWLFDPFLYRRDPAALRALDLHFADWCRWPGRDHSWVRLQIQWEPVDSFAWWQLDSPEQGRPTPIIEVAAEPPSAVLPTGLPEAVREAGWWILARIGPEEARQWIAAGVRMALWARQDTDWLGEQVQVRFPETRLAERRDGVWRPTSDGLAVVAGFRELGIRTVMLRGFELRQLASWSHGRLGETFEQLRDWQALLRSTGHWREDDGEVPEAALRWACGRIRFEEAPAWLDPGITKAYEAEQWWLQGFSAAGALLWRIMPPERKVGPLAYRQEPLVDPCDARRWHLDLYGLSEDLGPKRFGRRISPWTPPLTEQERRQRRRDRWDLFRMQVRCLPARLLRRWPWDGSDEE